MPSETPAADPTRGRMAGGERTTIGRSVQGREIEAYWFGSGERWIALIGGIHGGYEWNTALLAYEMIDYFKSHPEVLPEDLRVAVVPAANPDGLALAVGHDGRFQAQEVRTAGVSQRLNANGVDLNRNWDCGWQAKGLWRGLEVNAGNAPFSEAEAQVLRDFLTQPSAGEKATGAAETVVFWHSAAGLVLAGGCGERLPQGDALAQAYAEASGYTFALNFAAYTVTGAAVDWLAGQGIPAIEVELRNHKDTDWERNLAGVLAIIDMNSKDTRP